MMFWEVLLFAVVLSIDSFSAAFAMGFRHFSAKRAFSFAFSSAFAEGVATAIGFLLGSGAKDLIVNYDHWVAFGLLVAVGTHIAQWVILSKLILLLAEIYKLFSTRSFTIFHLS
jgi:manganese efflux pump family protein